jgi:guanine deaminase
MRDSKDDGFVREALRLAAENARSGRGGPFAALVVKDGEVLGHGCNEVTTRNDPTAHAEVLAIREACRRLGSFRLDGCTIYCSSEPCPMCLGAIYWAHLDRVFYANDRARAAAAGFDDAFIYAEIARSSERRKLPTHRVEVDGQEDPFVVWESLEDRVEY